MYVAWESLFLKQSVYVAGTHLHWPIQFGNEDVRAAGGCVGYVVDIKVFLIDQTVSCTRH